jgi:hypothetical protein
MKNQQDGCENQRTWHGEKSLNQSLDSIDREIIQAGYSALRNDPDIFKVEQVQVPVPHK